MTVARCRLLTCAAMVWWGGAVCSAASSASSLSALVTQADVIFIGEILHVQPYPVATVKGPIIRTRVTFRVDDALYGTRGGTEVLEFLGGEWNGVGLAVAGMPRFIEGQRHVVFAYRAKSVNPIVGFGAGFLRIAADRAGIDRVFSADVTVASGGRISGRAAASSVDRAMTLSDLRTHLRRAIAELRR